MVINFPFGEATSPCSISPSFTRLMSQAKPNVFSAQMPYQFISTSYQRKPCCAAVGCAWWLLCQPSPKVSSATHQLLVERSRVPKRRVPQECVAEFTSQVQWSKNTVRKNVPHSSIDKPPIANKMTPTTICGT